MIKFQFKYALLAIAIFLIEVVIALYVHDRIVRPYIGDYLVVMLIYCFLKSFLDVPATKLAIGVLLFSYFVEFMQYIGLVDILGLRGNRLAVIVIGVSFEWVDMLAYTLGVLTIIFIEHKRGTAKTA
ncbi:ribosomal maturation YjgA family protein [Fulvivirga ligni]|uniref:ribosomal maturation YjgA family protein n=1 Tax=Fulvivirga ligni TaxID=2904246 RepID=UPI001F23B0D7|nr:DUF2809 domain-containing protein [Fulvivirga ligni]UII19142.1 DUF2809 domain-containing protein [Fulvivirga ligni]